jgi:hypothetical protein
MHRALATLLAASACSCGTVPEPPSPAPAATRNERRGEHTRAPRSHFALSELADARTDESFLDPMSLEEWRVDAPGPDLIEIYAADADPDELIAELLPRKRVWISDSSDMDSVSGRLLAPSRSSAVEAIAEVIGVEHPREELAVGRGPSVSVRLVREPLDVVARTIEERTGMNVLLAMQRPELLSIVSRRVAAGVLLKEVARLLDADISLTARGWILHERDGGEIARMATIGGPVVGLVLDDVGAGEAIALVSMVTEVPRRATRPCGGPKKSGQVAAARPGPILAWLVAAWPRGRHAPCQLPSWRGDTPILRAELVGIAWHSPTRAAALLRFGTNDYAVIRPGQNGTARAVIGPTSIEVRERGRSIFEQSVEPRLKRPQPVYSDLPPIEPDHWRLAASVREGSSWRALLMHTSFEWRWVSERDPSVRRIERDRVVLAPVRAGGSDVELHLARLPDVGGGEGRGGSSGAEPRSARRR